MNPDRRPVSLLGITLLIFGAVVLLHKFTILRMVGFPPFFHPLHFFNGGFWNLIYGILIWKIALRIIAVLLIVWLIVHASRRSQDFGVQGSTPARKELRRSSTDRKFAGVCGGLAEYFNIDSTLVRIVYVMLLFGSLGMALLFYILLAFIVPEQKLTTI